VCQRLHFLLSEYDNNNNSQLTNSQSVANKPAAQQQHHAVTSTASTCPTTTTTNVPFTDTLNLLLMVVCRAFPTFPRVILPLASVTTTASKTNHDVKVLQQQLMDLVAWFNTQTQQQHG
jgi:hypothetical protein